MERAGFTFVIRDPAEKKRLMEEQERSVRIAQQERERQLELERRQEQERHRLMRIQQRAEYEEHALEMQQQAEMRQRLDQERQRLAQKEQRRAAKEEQRRAAKEEQDRLLTLEKQRLEEKKAEQAQRQKFTSESADGTLRVEPVAGQMQLRVTDLRTRQVLGTPSYVGFGDMTGVSFLPRPNGAWVLNVTFGTGRVYHWHWSTQEWSEPNPQRPVPANRPVPGSSKPPQRHPSGTARGMGAKPSAQSAPTFQAKPPKAKAANPPAAVAQRAAQPAARRVAAAARPHIWTDASEPRMSFADIQRQEEEDRVRGLMSADAAILWVGG